MPHPVQQLLHFPHTSKHVWHKSILSHELYAWKWHQNVRSVKHDSSEGGWNAYRTLVVKLKAGNRLGDVGIDGQIILWWVWKEQDGGAWTEVWVGVIYLLREAPYFKCSLQDGEFTGDINKWNQKNSGSLVVETLFKNQQLGFINVLRTETEHVVGFVVIWELTL